MDKDDDDKVDNNADVYDDDDLNYVPRDDAVPKPASILLGQGNHHTCCSSLHPEHQVRNYSLQRR